jgi:hypothetical protein
MPTHRESLTAAFDSRDLERLMGLLEERVIWRGVADEARDGGEDREQAPTWVRIPTAQLRRARFGRPGVPSAELVVGSCRAPA